MTADLQTAYSLAVSYASSFLNSQFVSALLGALAGAYGGQWIVERQSIKKRALEELRAINACIAILQIILNSTLAMKQQHVGPMIANHKNDLQRFEMIIGSTEPAVFEFQADWEALPATEFPLESLRERIHTQIDSSAQAISMLTMLLTAAAHLDTAIEERNVFIKEERAGSPKSSEQLLGLYFGLRQKSGVTDARYPSMLEAISEYVDAVAVFSAALASILKGHGHVAAKKLGKEAPHIVTLNLGAAIQSGLMPDPANYAGTLQAVGLNPKTVFQSLQ